MFVAFVADVAYVESIWTFTALATVATSVLGGTNKANIDIWDECFAVFTVGEVIVKTVLVALFIPFVTLLADVADIVAVITITTVTDGTTRVSR